MPRSKPRSSGTQAIRRSTRLIDQVDGTTGPRKRRSSEQPKPEDSTSLQRSRKRSVPKKNPPKQDRKHKNGLDEEHDIPDEEGQQVKSNSKKVSEKKKILINENQQKRTASKKRQASESEVKPTDEPKPVPKRKGSPAKSTFRKSEDQDKAPSSTRSKATRLDETTKENRKRSRSAKGTVAKGTNDRAVSTSSRRTTPQAVNGEPVDQRHHRACHHRLFLVSRSF